MDVGGPGHCGHVDDLQHAQTAVAALLADFAPEDWTRDSPCDGWDVAGVVRHLIVGERAFTTSLGGTPTTSRLTADVATSPTPTCPRPTPRAPSAA